MLQSLLCAALVIIVICWAVGAYNRLIKLKAVATQTGVTLKAFRQMRINIIPSHGGDIADEVQSHKLNAELQLHEDAYEAALARYNHAVTQIPTSWLAALYNMKPMLRSTSMDSETTGSRMRD